MRALLPVLALTLAPFASAQELEVHFFDVGQGDSTLIIGPDGTTFLLDGGPNGQGNSTLIPFLQGRGIQSLDYVAASHYHADHVGGLDEVWDAGIRATICLDRGDSNVPSTQTFNDYRDAYRNVRQTAVPGQVVALGGGATATCLVVEGELMGGGSVSISGSSQRENSASVAWRIEYGDFDLYLGGDLTGGGNGTADVEGPVGPLCGDVDVMLLSHHGSRTSSQPGFIQDLQPEAAIISCGAGNSYGHPKQETIDNVNSWDHVIPVWCTSEGTGGTGFVAVDGSIELRTDGTTWSMSAPHGLSLRAHCDGSPPSAAAVGDLVVSEIHRDPQRVQDSQGEWLELAGARVGVPVSLTGVSVRDAGVDRFDLATSIQLGAGEVCLLAASGLASANGGVRPQIAWPVGTMQLANSADRLELTRGGATLDQVDWTSSWPGGQGVSAERRDLLGAASAANFADGSVSFGLGDDGSPGRQNDADTTDFGNGETRVVVLTPPTLGGVLEMDWLMPGEAGATYQGWVTFDTSPGINVGGTHIPANQDTAWDRTHNLPGWSGVVPAGEAVFASVAVPSQASLRGRIVYALVVTLDLPDQVRTQATPVAMIVF